MHWRGKVISLEIMCDMKIFLSSNINEHWFLDFIILDKHLPTHLSPEQCILLALTDGTYVKVISNDIEQAAEYICDYEGADKKFLLHFMSVNELIYYKIIICCLGRNEFYLNIGTRSQGRDITIHVIISNLGDDMC